MKLRLKVRFEDSQRTCEANPVGENSSFIFTCNVQLFHSIIFGLSTVGSSTSDHKKSSKSTTKAGEMAVFYLQSFLTDHETWF